jgi:hypothetical protein
LFSTMRLPVPEGDPDGQEPPVQMRRLSSRGRRHLPKG